jgi:pilus assembly protein Flp/PilA
MTCIFKRFCADENGATSIEYALIASMIGIAIITSVTSVKDGLVERFSFIATQLGG